MAEYSDHYQLIMLGPGDNISDDDYGFTRRNIRKIDGKLYLGAEGHRHTGDIPDDLAPISGPSLVLSSGTGTIAGGRTIRYKYSLVDAYGQETAASPETTITTPPAVATPGGPSITLSYTGGGLLAGQYYYVVTAYKTTINQETVPSKRAYTTLLSGTTGLVTLNLPSLPTGATGFNIYRRSPGSTRFQYLDSVDMSVATPPTTYEDDGSVEEDCNRTIPNVNNTSSNYSVSVGIPGATPTVPDGFTWRLYRTYTTGDWDSSLLSWVVTETTEGSGIITPTYSDVGAATTNGTPLETNEQAGSPSKILLTDGAEVQGTLPPGLIVSHDQITFAQGGAIVAADGVFPFTCEHEFARIEHVRLACGPDTTSSVPIEVQIRKWDSTAATPDWADIFTTGQPFLPAGEWQGEKFVPDVQDLVQGDVLLVDITAGDDSATPTGENLVVTMLLSCRSGSTDTSLDLS